MPGVWTPPPEIPVACFVQAADRYSLPRVLLPAIIKVENRQKNPDAVRVNTNGTKDYGYFQHNTVLLKEYSRKFGIAVDVFKQDRCLAVMATAYKIRYEINRYGGDFWRGVGAYHSRTPSLNRRYAEKVYYAAQNIAWAQ